MALRRGWGAGAAIAVAVAAAGACSTFSAEEEAADAGTEAAAPGPDAVVPDAGLYAHDTFERTESKGFGTADIGGEWDTGRSLLLTTVMGGKGHFIVNPAGQNGRAYLADVRARDVEMHVVVRSARLSANARVFVSLQARGSADTDHYSAGAVMKSGAGKSTLSLGIGHPVGDGEILLKAAVLPLDVSAIDALELRVQIYGTNPVNLRMRAWESGASEPKEWQAVASDTVTTIGKAGPVGIEMYTDPDAGPPDSGTPFDVLVDDFEVTEPRAE